MTPRLPADCPPTPRRRQPRSLLSPSQTTLNWSRRRVLPHVCLSREWQKIGVRRQSCFWRALKSSCDGLAQCRSIYSEISDAPDLGPFSNKFLMDISCMQGKTVLLENHRTARESNTDAGLTQEAASLYHREGVSPKNLPCLPKFPISFSRRQRFFCPKLCPALEVIA